MKTLCNLLSIFEDNIYKLHILIQIFNSGADYEINQAKNKIKKNKNKK